MPKDQDDAGKYRVCPDCGGEAPTDAPTCAECGHRFLKSSDDN